jgi:cytochrome c oxidase subunit 3
MSTHEAQLHDPGAETLLLHHFDDVDQQHTSSMLGMWAFLATEVMFFGGLFLGYTIYRERYHEAFVLASRHLSVFWGGLNTVVLLTSSLTMALAVREAQLKRVGPLVRNLLLTMALGAGFLGIKAYEWSTDYREHLMPAINFDWGRAQSGTHQRGEGQPSSIRTARREAQTPLELPIGAPVAESPAANLAREAEMFFVLYFFMTGLHALHLIIGIVLVGIMASLVHRGWLSGAGETQIEVTGLYWHFIDIVWIFLYPLLYLIDVRT